MEGVPESLGGGRSCPAFAAARTLPYCVLSMLVSFRGDWVAPGSGVCLHVRFVESVTAANEMQFTPEKHWPPPLSLLFVVPSVCSRQSWPRRVIALGAVDGREIIRVDTVRMQSSHVRSGKKGPYSSRYGAAAYD
jgi:hypothetical protein